MKTPRAVPEAVIKRLSLYYRFLEKLNTSGHLQVISSLEMEKSIGISAAQIRKDLSYFGELGKKGIGYEIAELVNILSKILGIDRQRSAVLIGAGNLGRALVNYGNFSKYGLRIDFIFDSDLNKIGNTVGPATVLSTKQLANVIRNRNIQVGIITVPGEAAQKVAEELVDGGIKAIWNFAPIRLKLPENICIRDEDLAVGITSLIHYLNWDLNEDSFQTLAAYDRG